MCAAFGLITGDYLLWAHSWKKFKIYKGKIEKILNFEQNWANLDKIAYFDVQFPSISGIFIYFSLSAAWQQFVENLAKFRLSVNKKGF